MRQHPISDDQSHPSSRSPMIAGAALALLAAAAFATLPILGRLAIDDGLRSATLLQWRFGLASLAMAAIGAYAIPIERRIRIMLLGTGLIYTVQTSLYFGALERISAGTTALLLYLAPAFVVIYSLFFGRRPAPLQIVSVLVAVAGLAVIVGTPSAADASAVGLLMAAGSGATFAWYLLLGEIAFAQVPPLATAAHSMAGAFIGFTVTDIAIVGRFDIPSTERQWVLIAAIVAIPTLLAIPTLFAAISKIGAGPTSIIATTEPVFTIVFAALVLAEGIDRSQVLGGLLILLAAIGAQCSAARPGTRRDRIRR